MARALARSTARNAEAWTYPSGFVAALEGRLVTLGATRDLLAAGKLGDALARVRQSLIFGDLAEDAPPFTLAEGMDACWAAFVGRMVSACPNPSVADLFLRPIEWSAFRAFVRQQALESAPRRIPGSQVPESVWQQCWAGGDVAPAFEPFAAVAQAVRDALAQDAGDSWLVEETTLVGECRDLEHLARQTGSEAVAEWVTARLKLRLALALLRCRRSGWPHDRTAAAFVALGGTKQELAALTSPDVPDWGPTFALLGVRGLETEGGTPSPAVLERLVDDAVTDLVRGARGIPFGPEPVFAFLWAARTEALNLRLVVTGLAAGLSRDAVAGDLRQTYA